MSCQSSDCSNFVKSQCRLGKSGLKVSKIILGCMSFGSSEWEGSPWVLDEEESLKVIKAAWDGGINTWVSREHLSQDLIGG